MFFILRKNSNNCALSAFLSSRLFHKWIEFSNISLIKVNIVCMPRINPTKHVAKANSTYPVKVAQRQAKLRQEFGSCGIISKLRFSPSIYLSSCARHRCCTKLLELIRTTSWTSETFSLQSLRTDGCLLFKQKRDIYPF